MLFTPTSYFSITIFRVFSSQIFTPNLVVWKREFSKKWINYQKQTGHWCWCLCFVLCVYESFPTQWPTPHQFTKVPHCSAILLTSFLSKTVKTCCIIKERIWENNAQAKQTETSYSKRNKENKFKNFNKNLTHILREVWEDITSSALGQNSVKEQKQ